MKDTYNIFFQNWKKEEFLINGDPVNYDDAKGYKIAHILSVSPLKLKGIFKGEYSGVAYAECKENHKVPDLNCTCGFHSYKNLRDAHDELNKKWNSVLLKIENYGKIIEHSTGWRSFEQEVIEIILQNKCIKVFCKRKPVAVGFFSNFYVPFCTKHCKEDSTYSLTELFNMTGIEFSFLK